MLTKQYLVVGVENHPENDFINYYLKPLPTKEEQLKDPEKVYTPISGERLFSFSFVKDTQRKLIGKMLTIVDASISDERQCKAMKDLVRTAFNEELCFISDWGFDQDIIQESIADIPEEEIEAIDVEEALRS